MPTSGFRNFLYLAALPLLAPSPRGQMTHAVSGEPLRYTKDYERLLKRHHVLGATLLLAGDGRTARVDTSVRSPEHRAGKDTLYRVASITKMATALVTLSFVQEGRLQLDAAVADLLPGGGNEPVLQGITVRHLLSHQSALCDTASVDEALRRGDTWHEVLKDASIRRGTPGAQFRYCNFAFGLMGCVLEQLDGRDLAAIFRERLFEPLGMRASMDASALDEAQIMPISRVLRYHKGQDVTVTALGRKALTGPDPLRHFGHTAGAMYTDAPSLQRLMTLICSGGEIDGRRLFDRALIDEMKRPHATYGSLSRGMDYGLGLVLLRDEKLPGRLIIGHQGYAYGCADGAFADSGSGGIMVFLNGGCSEAREGRLGLCNRDLIRLAFGRELPEWK